ncbi:MAG TPA: hypothetical protein VFR94_25970 [Nitrososphaeraceae archaeon]|nr:hypothetical protein [Nitrososphaeraceae archaeon]
MSESDNKVNSFYYCDISIDKSKMSLLKEMSADGRISADHFSVKDGTVTTVLNEYEIDMLKKLGFKIEIKQNMLERAEQTKNEVIESRPIMESDNLLSSFVDRYLDTQGILSKYLTLHNEFSSISQILDLPYETSGYDGSNVNLRIGFLKYTNSGLYLVAIIILAYAFYPIKIRTGKFPKTTNLEDALFEYFYVKKILYIEIPILIIIAIFTSIASMYTIDVFQPIYSFGRTFAVLTLIASFLVFIGGLMITLLVSVTGGIIWMILQSLLKEPLFYLAKAHLMRASDEKDENKKVIYLIKSIEYYDKYLRRRLNLRINNLKEIYSKLILDPAFVRTDVMESLITAFGEDDEKLKPAKYLSQISDIQETSKFLVEESIKQKINDFAIFLATIIPIAIAIIRLLLQE